MERQKGKAQEGKEKRDIERIRHREVGRKGKPKPTYEKEVSYFLALSHLNICPFLPFHPLIPVMSFKFPLHNFVMSVPSSSPALEFSLLSHYFPLHVFFPTSCFPPICFGVPVLSFSGMVFHLVLILFPSWFLLSASLVRFCQSAHTPSYLKAAKSTKMNNTLTTNKKNG